MTMGIFMPAIDNRNAVLPPSSLCISGDMSIPVSSPPRSKLAHWSRTPKVSGMSGKTRINTQLVDVAVPTKLLACVKMIESITVGALPADEISVWK
jgi:hypothetical protein